MQTSYWQGWLKGKMLLYPEYQAVNGASDASEKNLRSKWESKDCPFLAFYILMPLFHKLFSYGYVRNKFLLLSLVIQSPAEVWSPQTTMFALYCFKHENNFPYREISIIWKTCINSNKSFKTIINVSFSLELDSPFQFLRLHMAEDTFLTMADHKLMYLNVDLSQMLLPTFYTPIINPPWEAIQSTLQNEAVLPNQQSFGKVKWGLKKKKKEKESNKINGLHYLRHKNLKTQSLELDHWLVEMERWYWREALPLVVLSGKGGDLKLLIKFVTYFTWKFPPALQQEDGSQFIPVLLVTP